MEREEGTRLKQFARPDQDCQGPAQGVLGGGKLKHAVGC